MSGQGLVDDDLHQVIDPWQGGNTGKVKVQERCKCHQGWNICGEVGFLFIIVIKLNQVNSFF